MNANVERFSGFSDIYNNFRPVPPEKIVNIATKYLGHKPTIVVDLGSGTGLSTKIWKSKADRIIGIEPNKDMREEAKNGIKCSDINFIEGLSNKIPIESESVDIVTCSQSFHWMEPKSTLREVGRILKYGGIFLAYDYDWPPTIDYNLENSFLKLRNRADEILQLREDINKRASKWRKSDHLKEIRNSGEFDFVKEIVIDSIEECTMERFIYLALSLGGVQTAIKKYNEDIEKDIEIFKNEIYENFKSERKEIIFSYRIRLGIKYKI